MDVLEVSNIPRPAVTKKGKQLASSWVRLRTKPGPVTEKHLPRPRSSWEVTSGLRILIQIMPVLDSSAICIGQRRCPGLMTPTCLFQILIQSQKHHPTWPDTHLPQTLQGHREGRSDHSPFSQGLQACPRPGVSWGALLPQWCSRGIPTPVFLQHLFNLYFPCSWVQSLFRLFTLCLC